MIGKLLAGLTFMLCAVSAPRAQTLDEVYKRALTEGGTLNFYATLAQVNAVSILPAFEKRFPGIKVNHVDATSDQLAARVIAESRGGKVVADVFQTLLDGMIRVQNQGLFLEKLYPEAAEYPAELKGTTWVATDLIYIVAAWNTTKVKKQEEPKQFDDFADPRWKNQLIAEPRDFQLLLGLAKHNIKAMRRRLHYLSALPKTTSSSIRAIRNWPSCSSRGKPRPASPVTRIITRVGNERARRWITC